jgi:hypothetical protein
MKRTGYIAVILVLLLSGINNAIAQNRNNLVITDDHLTLQIDIKSPPKVLDSMLEIAGISKSAGPKVSKGDFTALSNDGWNVAGQENNIVRFERPLTDLNNNPQSRPYFITTRIPHIEGKPGYPNVVKYGVNKFAKLTVYELSSGLTRFILPGAEHAKRVFLSGNFNEWSTLKGLMKKADGGWLLDIKLDPGVYEYKYIIDGHWTTDPDNLQETGDGAGNTNSVYFKYNYTFKLAAYATARRVSVAGDFNKWNANELIMQKEGSFWQYKLYLSDGMHAYRFMVDGQWITDPANPAKMKDDDGNLNSILNLGETADFKLTGHANAKKVYVAGSFNDWKPDEYRLQKNGDLWTLQLVLTAGNYNYKFIVDGQWITDPSNPCYSTEKGQTNSFIAVKPNHTFKLKGFGDAKKVILTGTFDNWDPDGYTLAHVGDEWVIDFYLKPGKYLYKFRVDGKWIIDPGNKLWEQNEYNTGNSVLWIE